MIIKVCGGATPLFQREYKQEQKQAQTRYYAPQTSAQKVKKDFGIVLDAEIKRLNINVLI